MRYGSTARPARLRSVARVLGSVGGVGAAPAVAGAATRGTFTDSTTPAPVSLDSGTVSIDLSAADGSATVPLSFDGIVPGASATQALDLANTGDSALASVQLTTVATRSSLMDGDPVNGLQLTVRSCSVAWSAEATSADDAFADQQSELALTFTATQRAGSER